MNVTDKKDEDRYVSIKMFVTVVSSQFLTLVSFAAFSLVQHREELHLELRVQRDYFQQTIDQLETDVDIMQEALINAGLPVDSEESKRE